MNTTKSAVGRPWTGTFLEFTFTQNGKVKKIKMSEKALAKLKTNVRMITPRTRGLTLLYIVSDLRKYLLAWKGYFGITDMPTPLRELDKWIRRKSFDVIFGSSGIVQVIRNFVSGV